MSNFYVGQKVVCVDASNGSNWLFNPLRKGCEYTVFATNTCACGFESIDIGIASYARGSSCTCGAVINDGVWLFRTSRFRPLDSLTEQIERIEEEGAPVELEPEYA